MFLKTRHRVMLSLRSIFQSRFATSISFAKEVQDDKNKLVKDSDNGKAHGERNQDLKRLRKGAHLKRPLSNFCLSC